MKELPLYVKFLVFFHFDLIILLSYILQINNNILYVYGLSQRRILNSNFPFGLICTFSIIMRKTKGSHLCITMILVVIQLKSTTIHTNQSKISNYFVS